MNDAQIIQKATRFDPTRHLKLWRTLMAMAMLGAVAGMSTTVLSLLSLPFLFQSERGGLLDTCFQWFPSIAFFGVLVCLPLTSFLNRYTPLSETSFNTVALKLIEHNPRAGLVRNAVVARKGELYVYHLRLMQDIAGVELLDGRDELGTLTQDKKESELRAWAELHNRPFIEHEANWRPKHI